MIHVIKSLLCRTSMLVLNSVIQICAYGVPQSFDRDHLLFPGGPQVKCYIRGSKVPLISACESVVLLLHFIGTK